MYISIHTHIPTLAYYYLSLNSLFAIYTHTTYCRLITACMYVQ
ncbi:hypothetical protein M3J09_005528 [Ascochyta lentis]